MENVADILSMQEYLGHTVNFKTGRVSYKDKKSYNNSPSKWVIIKNTHEAIIDQDTFDIVQKLRPGRKRTITPMGEMPILFGMIYCADYGEKLYVCRTKSIKKMIIITIVLPIEKEKDNAHHTK